VPKGIAEPDEAPDAVAAREFAEETGFELSAVAADPLRPPVDLGEVTLKSGKVIHTWAVEGDLDPGLAHSNEFEIEWPPRSGRRQMIPEVDRVAWFGPDEARRRAHPAQAAFVERLEAALRL
jgi:predicted NUDIX family NTP pyrophosphohydrolase